MKLSVAPRGAFLVFLAIASATLAATPPDRTSSSPGSNGSAPPHLRSATDRAVASGAQEAALAELDDSSAMRRADALSDILAAGDPILRDEAVRKVAGSTDTELKSVLLRWMLNRPNKAYIFDFDSCQGTAQDMKSRCENFMQHTNGELPLVIKISDPSDGAFQVYSATLSHKEAGIIQAGPGRVVEDRIEFSVSLEYAYLGNPVCGGQFKLLANSTMSGRLTCGQETYSGNLSII